MNAIRSWWQKMGRTVYGGAYHLLVHRRWRRQQRLQDPPVEVGVAAIRQPGLTITVCHYPPGSDDQMKQLHLQRHEFHADWNYTIRPRKADSN